MTTGASYEEFAGPRQGYLPTIHWRSALDAGENSPLPAEGRNRVAIENVTPIIDGGSYPIKRVAGEQVVVEADLFADSHVLLSAVVKYRFEESSAWLETPMERVANDRWRGNFTVTKIGTWLFNVEAWVDHFKSWRDELHKRVQAGQDVRVELLTGAKLIEEAANRAGSSVAGRLREWASQLRQKSDNDQSFHELAFDSSLGNLVIRHAEHAFASSLQTDLRVTVDPERARFSSWYEMFPRSCPGKCGAHGIFKDCEAQLNRIAEMGFDVLYFPPIHPIGRSFRKGKNNNPNSTPEDAGSPWAIGGIEGGHKDVHPELGTLEDFQRLVSKAKTLGIEIALDIAFQCSPDHPYLQEHRDWFRKRADGSIAYAENPPKKYQDIYPFDFECKDWRGLWIELKSIFEFWIEQGVKIFRVDNPHTKSFSFWEWCLGELKRKWPDLIFLSEAFTRPSMMYRLAKIGFTQSYNYFPWRNSKYELTTYLTELNKSPLMEYFRPNLWPNTPDILTEFLQHGGRAAFEMRLILAATLGSSYGIYGPAFELCENTPLKPGGEEYLNSEKYEIRNWNLNLPKNITDLVTRINHVRRENPALQFNRNLKFHQVENDNLIAYTKATDDNTDIVLTVVNLDPYHTQSGWVDLTLDGFLADPKQSYQMHDLLTGARFIWHGQRNFIELDPNYSPGHIFRLRRRVRTERDFDYFM